MRRIRNLLRLKITAKSVKNDSFIIKYPERYIKTLTDEQTYSKNNNTNSIYIYYTFRDNISY